MAISIFLGAFRYSRRMEVGGVEWRQGTHGRYGGFESDRAEFFSPSVTFF
jgi:hypothetical protein